MMFLLFAALGAAPEPMVCCSSVTVKKNMTYYLRLQRSLAAEGDRDWSGVMYGWAPVAARSRDPSLSNADRQVLDEIAGLIVGVKNGPKRKVRHVFPEISKRMTYLVLRHPGGGTALREGTCPGVGPWLQSPGTLASPYEGCGSWASAE